MSDPVDLERFVAAQNAFGAVVAHVAAEQWTHPTPCSQWDVRALVNHVAVEQLWAVPLLEGKTIADVGKRLDGDQLGDDPKRGWWDAATQSRAIFDSQELLWLSGVITVFQDISAQLVAAGMFAAPVPVSDDAGLQVKLLAAVGRT